MPLRSLLVQQQLAYAHRLISLEQNNSAPLISCCKIVACMIEFDGGNYVGCNRSGLVLTDMLQQVQSKDIALAQWVGSNRTLLTFSYVLHVSLITEAPALLVSSEVVSTSCTGRR